MGWLENIFWDYLTFTGAPSVEIRKKNCQVGFTRTWQRNDRHITYTMGFSYLKTVNPGLKSISKSTQCPSVCLWFYLTPFPWTNLRAKYIYLWIPLNILEIFRLSYNSYLPVFLIPLLQKKTLNNEFIRCFHQFVFPIFSTNFSQYKQLKKAPNFLAVQNSFYFSVCQLKKIITNSR